MSEPLAATVIGGYLGAGKTTLVNQLLRHADGQRLAILVNEFGALPIDEDLIEAENDELISIAGGCICCSFGSDLTAALIDMAARTPRPDHVIIESSGVAMPAAIGASIGLLNEYALASIVVLADCETVRQHAADEYLGDTTLRQLHDADLIVQTKVDLVSESACAEVDLWLARINPRAARVQAEQGSVPNAVVLGQREGAVLSLPAAHADDAFESRVFAVDRPVDPELLARQLAEGSGVVRAKGFVSTDDGRIWLIQTVGKRWRATVYTGEVSTEIVCIGLRGLMDNVSLEKLFDGRGH